MMNESSTSPLNRIKSAILPAVSFAAALRAPKKSAKKTARIFSTDAQDGLTVVELRRIRDAIQASHAERQPLFGLNGMIRILERLQLPFTISLVWSVVERHYLTDRVLESDDVRIAVKEVKLHFLQGATMRKQLEYVDTVGAILASESTGGSTASVVQDPIDPQQDPDVFIDKEPSRETALEEQRDSVTPSDRLMRLLAPEFHERLRHEIAVQCEDVFAGKVVSAPPSAFQEFARETFQLELVENDSVSSWESLSDLKEFDEADDVNDDHADPMDKPGTLQTLLQSETRSQSDDTLAKFPAKALRRLLSRKGMSGVTPDLSQLRGLPGNSLKSDAGTFRRAKSVVSSRRSLQKSGSSSSLHGEKVESEQADSIEPEEDDGPVVASRYRSTGNVLSAELLEDHHRFQKQSVEEHANALIREKERKYARTLRQRTSSHSSSTIGTSPSKKARVGSYLQSSIGVRETQCLGGLADRPDLYLHHGNANIYSRGVSRINEHRQRIHASIRSTDLEDPVTSPPRKSRISFASDATVEPTVDPLKEVSLGLRGLLGRRASVAPKEVTASRRSPLDDFDCPYSSEGVREPKKAFALRAECDLAVARIAQQLAPRHKRLDKPQRTYFLKL